MKKICVVGAFGFSDLKATTGGQPVKTRELYYALKEHYGDQVRFVETYQWKRRPLRMLWQLLCNVPKSDAVIMLPAHNGIRVFSRLLRFLKRPGARLYYDVIGGWLPEAAREDTGLLRNLKILDGIWVETAGMETLLRQMGLEKVKVVPNFKTLPMLTPEQLVYPQGEPYRLCTFSRVMESKGIGDAIKAVSRVNEALGRKAFTLDVYGPVAPDYEQTFHTLCRDYEAVTYKGVADPAQSVAILKNYFALLFPTKFYTEGIPGTVIDGYAAGVPVIASQWCNFEDVISQGVTGIGYPFGDAQALETILLAACRDPEPLLKMKQNCLTRSLSYQPQEVLRGIARDLETAP